MHFLSDIEFIAPYTVERRPNELHYTYLDTVGRPVIVIQKKNAVQNHIQDFQVIATIHSFVCIFMNSSTLFFF